MTAPHVLIAVIAGCAVVAGCAAPATEDLRDRCLDDRGPHCETLGPTGPARPTLSEGPGVTGEQTEAEGRAEMEKAAEAEGPTGTEEPGKSDAQETTETRSPRECPTHWHSTFGIFIPDEDGNPVQVDFLAPRTPGGQHYYDYASKDSGGAPFFTMSLHLHITGGDAGDPSALGPAQFHMERPGACMGVREALRRIEVDATADSLFLGGAHAQVPAQSGRFTATPEAPLRWWVETQGEDCAFAWEERAWLDVKDHQLRDGESLLVALGPFDAAVVAELQDRIPQPISRAGIIALC